MTSQVKAQNSHVLQSLKEIYMLDPQIRAMIQGPSTETTSSVNVLAKAEYLFNEMRAKLKRLVAS